MNRLSKQLIAIEEIAKAINEKAFNNELPKIAITMQGGGAGSVNSYGWFWAERWVSKDEKVHELNITAENIDNILQLFITMQHELIHLYAKINDIQDTSRQGRWHNKNFQKLCEKFGLGYEKDKSIGTTTPSSAQSEDFVKWVTTTYKTNEKIKDWVESGEIFKRAPSGTKKEKKEKTSKNYQCTTCEEKVSLKIELVETLGEFYCPYCGKLNHVGENEEE